MMRLRMGESGNVNTNLILSYLYPRRRTIRVTSPLPECPKSHVDKCQWLA